MHTVTLNYKQIPHSRKQKPKPNKPKNHTATKKQKEKKKNNHQKKHNTETPKSWPHLSPHLFLTAQGYQIQNMEHAQRITLVFTAAQVVQRL